MRPSRRYRPSSGYRRAPIVVVALAFCLVATGFLAGSSSNTSSTEREIGLAGEDGAGAAPSEDVRAPLDYTEYEIVKGDTLSGIAERYGLRVDTLVSYNEIQASREIRYGDRLRVPNQDGILYTVREGDSVESIAGRYAVPAEPIRIVNRIAVPAPGNTVFLPGARLDADELTRINGDLFIWPARGAVSSPFGVRKNPFTCEETFHHGVDLAVPWGSRVVASMAGTVAFTGRDDPSIGNYVVLSHGGGYRTYYYHLRSISVKRGQRVAQAQTIGFAGDTGAVTGAHLHFGVSRNGTYFNPSLVVGKATNE